MKLGEVSKKLGDMWKNSMSEEDKQPYKVRDSLSLLHSLPGSIAVSSQMKELYLHCRIWLQLKRSISGKLNLLRLLRNQRARQGW